MSLEDNLIVATRAAPHLDPATLYGIAATTPDDLVATASKAVGGFASASQLRAYVERNDSAVQTAIWTRLDPATQKMLGGTGYRPPEITRIEDLPPEAQEKVREEMAKVAAGRPGPVGTVLHAIGGPLRAVHHAYRAAASITDELRSQGYSAFGPEAFQRTFSPDEWARAWDRTQGEEETFSPIGIKALQGDQATLDEIPEDVRRNIPRLDPDGIRLAKLVSANRANPQASIDEAVEGIPDEEKAAVVERMQRDPDIAKAAVWLDGQKYSLGRRVAHTVGLDPTKSGKAWTVVSGATDAVWSWFGDPTVVGLEAVKGVNQIRYLVRDASDVERLVARPSVARHLDDVASYLADGRYGALVERYPRYAGVVDQLAAEGVTTGEALGKWFQGTQGLTALLDGTVSGVAKSVKIRVPVETAEGVAKMKWKNVGTFMPRVSALGMTRLDLKVATKKAIDFAADMPKSGLGRVVAPAGRLARRMTTLIPRGVEFDPSTPAAVTQVQRMAATALPAARVRDLVDAWVGASGDLGVRFGIYKGLLSEVFRAAGVDATVEGRQFIANFMGKLEAGAGKRAYSVGSIDQMGVGGKQASVGILGGQLTSMWSLPSYKVLWAQSKRLSLMRGVYNVTGVNLTEAADRFMTTAWKPAALLRLGFPVRAGGEELVGAIMREGLVSIARGKLAAGVAQAAEREAVEGVPRILPWNPLRGMWNRMSEHVPPTVTDPAEAVARYIGGRTAKALRFVEGKLAGDDYVQAARELWDHGIMQSSFADEISAVMGRGGSWLADPDNAVRMTRDGSKMRPIYFRRTGAFREYAPTEGLYNQAWQDSLGEIATDKLARRALEHAGESRAAQVDAVYDLLRSPEAATLRQKALRATQTRDGRIVGETATEEEALRDWASAVVDHVAAHTRSAGGDLIYPELAADLLSTHRPPSMDRLAEVPLDVRPVGVKGAEVVPIPVSGLKRMVDRGFAEIVGRPIDWMVRQPLFVHNYVEAKREVEGLRSLLMTGAERKAAVKAEAAAQKAGEKAYREALKLPREDVTDLAHQTRANQFRNLAVKQTRSESEVAQLAARVDIQVREVAVQRAVNKTSAFVDDNEIRSQFAVTIRNLFPFWAAQEQFYGRWARQLVHSPEAFRQAQLVMMGLRHSGFLKQDEKGDDYYMYPATSVVQDVLTRGMELVTGEKARLPLPVGFSGKVKFSTPGFGGYPSVGPFVGVAVHALRARFPELAPAEQFLLTERGAGRPYWEQIVPTTIARLWHVFADEPETSAQMGSAMMQAMAYLEASGHGLPDDATVAEKEQFIDRTKNWTRVLLATRAIYGFSAPAAPELQLDPDDLHQEYRDLLRTLPIEEATREFIARHPDATAYTVFQSQSKTGVPLPATEGTFRFMNDHRAFLESYRQAGGLFLPQASRDAAFSVAAYREQLATEMRVRKTPQGFLDDILFAQAADEYFSSRDRKEAALKQYRGTPKAAQVRQTWVQWKDGFMASHPTFEMMLAETGANAAKKQQQLDELRLALSDPRAPRTTQSTQMRELLAAYDNHLTFQEHFSGLNTQVASIRRKAEAKSFASWAEEYVGTNPDVKPLYDRLMREQVD